MAASELLPMLVAESAKKSRVCWLSWAGAGAPRLVWHVWYDEALVVLSADGEQLLPGLAEATTAEVTMRSKDSGARLVTWTGSVQVVLPDSPAWDGHLAALLGVRLNLPDPAAATAAWRATGTVVRIVPAGTAEGLRAGPLP